MIWRGITLNPSPPPPNGAEDGLNFLCSFGAVGQKGDILSFGTPGGKVFFGCVDTTITYFDVSCSDHCIFVDFCNFFKKKLRQFIVGFGKICRLFRNLPKV